MVDSSTISRKIYIGLLAIYFATIPIENVLETGYGSVHKFLGLGILCLTFLLARIRYLRIRRIKMLLVFVGICSISFFWAFTSITNDYLRTVMFLALFTTLILQIDISFSEFEFIRFCICTTSALLSVLMMFSSKYRVVSLVDAGRYTFGINGVEVDNNNLCLALSFSILFAIDYFLRNKTKLKWYYLVMAIFSLSAMLFSGSRGGFLSLAIGALSYIWIYGGKRVKPKTIALSTAGVFFVSFLGKKILPQSILERFTIASVLASGGTGRTKIWIDALHEFWNANVLRLLFGYGFGSFPQFYQTFCGRYKAAHNDFIEILIELGIFGLFFYLLCLAGILRRLKKEKNALGFSITMLIIVGSLSMELLIKKMYWMGIFFACVDVIGNECLKE